MKLGFILKIINMAVEEHIEDPSNNVQTERILHTRGPYEQK